MKHWLSGIFVCIVILVVAAWIYEYTINKNAYISTNNASLQADTYTLTASQTGVVSSWDLSNGKTVQTGNMIGQVQNQPITIPTSGTVIANSIYANQNVLQGQMMATIADLNHPYVLAFIDEDEVKEVMVGQKVNVLIDSLIGEEYIGKVVSIGKSTGDITTASPSLNSNSTEKIVQRVPVKITINNLPTSKVTLGVHAEIKIEK
jgi:multidrug resistance efflux pump